MSRTVQDGLRAITAILRREGIEDAPREARLILAQAMKVDAGRMTLLAQDPLADELQVQAMSFAMRRARGEPLSHIRGYREFYGRRFDVDSRVLDPRPETECLIYEALQVPFAEVLDLGTGSGCILTTLLAERLSATGIGTDLSSKALEVAHLNAEKHGVIDRCNFIESDWYSAVEGQFDLIVSNPPYIAADEMSELSVELGFEPRMALTDEADGLTAYRNIVARAAGHLKPKGRLIVEIGASQGDDVARLMRESGLDHVSVSKDLDGRDRVVFGRIR